MMIRTSYQFKGLPHEDPYAHIADFLEICATFKIDGASEDDVNLRLFPFSLKGNAKRWLHNLPAGSIRTWKDMADNFLRKYCPNEKTAMMMREIFAFSQGNGEPLYKALDRFKDLLKICPDNGSTDRVLLETFCCRLSENTREIVNLAAGGSVLDRAPGEIYELIENLTSRH